MTQSMFNIAPGAQPFPVGALLSEKDISAAAVPAQPLADARVQGMQDSVTREDIQPQSVMPAKVVVLEPDKKLEEGGAGTQPEAKIVSCPACGCNLTEANGEPVVTDEEKNRWLRHVLGEDRFRQTLTLFNGLVEVRFRSRTTAENDDIFNQLGAEIKLGDIPEVPAYSSPAYVARMYRYMLTLSMEKLTKYDPQGVKPAVITTFPEVTAANYPPIDAKDHRKPLVRAHDQLLLGMSEGVLAAIMATHKRFELLMGVLLHHTEDPDFWKPTVAGT